MAQPGRTLSQQPPPGASSRYVCDAMLGKLARWLRLLGFDTLYSSAFSDDALLTLAAREERTLVTRNVRLAGKMGGEAILITGGGLREQLRAVLAGAPPSPGPRPFSRCSLCNAALIRLTAQDAEGLVPEYIRARHATFSSCPGCGRAYWGGSHRQRMLHLMEPFLKPAGDGSD